MPSSSAFTTSSWFRRYAGESVIFSSALARYGGNRKSAAAGMNEMHPYEAVVIAPAV